jgi:coenzyme F420-reducing hydrogenase gamma subunit
VNARVRQKVAVWKFASCDGCQLTLLDCEDELLPLTEAVEIAYFLEATSATVAGPYDVSLVEGSITTQHDVERILAIREQSRYVVAIGACATAGGIQALRNYADVHEYTAAVYAHPHYIDTLETSTPFSHHIRVDYELHGCPISKTQLIDLLGSIVIGKVPRQDYSPVCMECKRSGTACLLVAGGQLCLGPVTHSGCGALCPSFDRACFGCFGPSNTTNIPAMIERLRALGTDTTTIDRLLSTFTAMQFRPVGVEAEQ